MVLICLLLFVSISGLLVSCEMTESYSLSTIYSPDTSRLGSFLKMLDRRVHKVIIPQPFCSGNAFIICLGNTRFCMGKRLSCKGNSAVHACVGHFLQYKPYYLSIFTTIFTLFHLQIPLPTSLFLYFFKMALNWVPPPNGTLKVNVHGVSFDAPMPNGNRNGMGIVLRTSNGNLVNCIAGVIPGLSPLENQLSAVMVGLRRAFIEGVKSVIIETDNMAAFGAVQMAHQNQHPQVAGLIQQILTRIRDPNWTCSFRFVYSARNSLATYLSLLGGELFCRLYIFYEPIGRMAELMDLDMGLGPNDPQFLEAPMVEEEWEVFEEIMDDGAGILADAFMANLVLHVPVAQNDEIQMQDVVFEEELLDESDEDDLFDLF